MRLKGKRAIVTGGGSGFGAGIVRKFATEGAAEILESYLKVHQVFHLSCPDRAELARRMRKRALKENRMDDASDVVIEQRIKTYEEETKPIIEYYSDELVTEIDASRPPPPTRLRGTPV